MNLPALGNNSSYNGLLPTTKYKSESKDIGHHAVYFGNYVSKRPSEFKGAFGQKKQSSNSRYQHFKKRLMNTIYASYEKGIGKGDEEEEEGEGEGEGEGLSPASAAALEIGIYLKDDGTDNENRKNGYADKMARLIGKLSKLPTGTKPDLTTLSLNKAIILSLKSEIAKEVKNRYDAIVAFDSQADQKGERSALVSSHADAVKAYNMFMTNNNENYPAGFKNEPPKAPEPKKGGGCRKSGYTRRNKRRSMKKSRRIRMSIRSPIH